MKILESYWDVTYPETIMDVLVAKIEHIDSGRYFTVRYDFKIKTINNIPNFLLDDKLVDLVCEEYHLLKLKTCERIK